MVRWCEKLTRLSGSLGLFGTYSQQYYTNRERCGEEVIGGGGSNRALESWDEEVEGDDEEDSIDAGFDSCGNRSLGVTAVESFGQLLNVGFGASSREGSYWVGICEWIAEMGCGG